LECAGNLFTPSPPRPEITYGEFPFRIEYEIHGERIVVEDTIICKFDGFTSVSCDSSTRYRDWKASFASGRKTLYHDGADYLVDDANQIYFDMGSAKYYLGKKDEYFSFHAYKITISPWGSQQPATIEIDELYDTYGIKVISYELPEPIVNTFK
jgi:hypothetical protein